MRGKSTVTSVIEALMSGVQRKLAIQIGETQEIAISRMNFSLVRNCIFGNLCIGDHIAPRGPRSSKQF